MNRPAGAALPATCLAFVAVFLVASGVTASLATDPYPTDRHTQTTWDDEGLQSVTTLSFTQPRDLVRIEMQRLQPHGPDPASVRFYVVEGGQGQALLAGREATVIHAGHYPDWGFQFTRPAPEGDAAVDLVFVHERPPGTTDAEHAAHVNDLQSAVSGLRVHVANGRMTALQPLWYAGAAVAFAAFAVTAVRWNASRSQRVPPPPDVAPLERLLGVQAMAHRYLRGLRDALRVTGALLAVGGLAGVAAAMRLEAALEPAPRHWRVFIVAGAWVAWGAAMWVWGLHYRRAAAEMRRWDSAPAPEV